MGNLNKVMLIGRMGQDPEKRVTPSGYSVVNCSIATSEYFKDQAGNRQERTEWHNLVFWNQLADRVEQYCKKGSQIYVEGSLQTQEYQDRDGNKRYKTVVNVRNIQFLDSKPQNQQGNQTQQPRQNRQTGQYQQAGQQQQQNQQNQQQNQYQQPPQGGGYRNQINPAYGGQSPPPAQPPYQGGFMEDDIPF